MNLGFAFGFDDGGRARAVDDPLWVRGMIEQLLFTAPGERVMRPDFGSGALQLVFAPNSPELAAAIRLLIEGALRRYLGDLIEVEALSVAAGDAELRIEIAYRLIASGVGITDSFALAAGGAP